jgi:hypothetical protein
LKRLKHRPSPSQPQEFENDRREKLLSHSSGENERSQKNTADILTPNAAEKDRLAGQVSRDSIVFLANDGEIASSDEKGNLER